MQWITPGILSARGAMSCRYIERLKLHVVTTVTNLILGIWY